MAWLINETEIEKNRLINLTCIETHVRVQKAINNVVNLWWKSQDFSRTGHFDRIVFSKLRNYLLKVVLTQRKKTEEIAPCVQRIVKKRILKFRRVRKDSWDYKEKFLHL